MRTEQPGEFTSRRVFFRRVLVLGGTVLASPLLQACGAGAPPAPASTSVPPTVSPTVTSGQDATGADLAAAQKEGKLVWYTPTALGPDLLSAFGQKYPFVDTSGFLLLQAGSLYSKITSEMQANVQSADVFTTSEVSNAIDFQNKGWYVKYDSPQASVFDAKWQSNPTGYWISANIELAGIGWNPTNLPDATAPQTWTDLLDPKWNGQLMTKDSSSGQQYELYAMITAMHGDTYWDQFATQKPHPVVANAGLFDALLNGQYQINACCQQSTYSTMKRKGAPLSMAFPKDGVGQIMSVSGVVHNAPHPNVAKLFVDWLCSPDGAQTISQVTLAPSTRPGTPPPQFMPSLDSLNVWTPPDLKAYVAGQPAWVDKWKKIIGAG
jgi:iron(III) transport system substrate-binding protein